MNQTYPTSNKYPGIPTPKAIKQAVLEHVQDGSRYMFGDIYAAMVGYFKLTPEQEEITFPYARNHNQGGSSGGAPSGANVFYKYCNNACQELVNEACLDDGRGGFFDNKEYRITEEGLRRI